MKFSSLIALTLASLATASPILNDVDNSGKLSNEKRTFGNIFNWPKYTPVKSSSVKTTSTKAPVPTPSWTNFGNSSVISTTSFSTKASTSTVSPSKTTSSPTKTPTPTSPEAIASAIAKDVSDLLQDILDDLKNIAQKAGADFSSIFGNSGFSFFKREEELAVLEARTFTPAEIEAQLGTLVTNVLGHLVTLTNNTNVSLAQSLLTALHL